MKTFQINRDTRDIDIFFIFIVKYKKRNFLINWNVGVPVGKIFMPYHLSFTAVTHTSLEARMHMEARMKKKARIRWFSAWREEQIIRSISVVAVSITFFDRFIYRYDIREGVQRLGLHLGYISVPNREKETYSWEFIGKLSFVIGTPSNSSTSSTSSSLVPVARDERGWLDTLYRQNKAYTRRVTVLAFAKIRST